MAAPHHVELRSGTALVSNARVAYDWFDRLRGLLGVRSLTHPDGLLITHCSSVHSFWMRMTIDVVYLDDDFEVKKVVSRLRPWRISFGGRRTSQTLELPAGTIESLGIAAGQSLERE